MYHANVKLDVRKCNSNHKCKNDKCRCESKNPITHHVSEKDYIWNPSTCRCENDKYLESIIDDLVVTSDKMI